MMLLNTIASLALIGFALAQTPAGFTPSVNKTLDVSYGTTFITPGMMVKKSITAKQPTISVTGETLLGKYLLAMIDIDVPSGSKRTTVLHTLLSDFVPGTPQNGTTPLTTKATGPASYMGPAPPAETPKHPHNYIFLLHAQPDNFSVPASQKGIIQNRMGIDWVKFMADAGLRDPLYANYLQVQSGDTTKRQVELHG